MERYKQFFHSYNAVYRPYVNQLNIVLQEFHLYSSQWRIMHYIWHNGPKNVSEITQYQKVEKPTTTKMIQRLVALEYLEATAGEDKRIKVIQLTDKGISVCQEVQEKIYKFHDYLLKDVSKEEQQIATHVLETISTRIPGYEIE